MVKDIRRRGGKNFQCAFHTATEIRYQRLDFNGRVLFADSGDTVGKVLSTAITQVITVHGGDHHVAQTHIGDGLCQFFRFVSVRCRRATVGDVAEWATAGTNRAEDHKGRGTVVETFGKV